MSANDLETRIRASLRTRADDIPNVVPPYAAAGVLRPAPPVRHRRAWAAVAVLAAASVAAVLIVPRVGDGGGVRVVDSGPGGGVVELGADTGQAKDQVVYRGSWGSGPQQLGNMRAGMSDAHPEAIAPTPDGSQVFVADIANGRVARIDVKAGRVVQTYPDGSEGSMAVDPASGRVFVMRGTAVESFDPASGNNSFVTRRPADGEIHVLLSLVEPAAMGVYVATVGDPKIDRVSGQPRTLPGFPLGGAYMRTAVANGRMRVEKVDESGQVQGDLELRSTGGWKIGAVRAATVYRSRLRVYLVEYQGTLENPTVRSRVVDISPDLRVITVFTVPDFQGDWLATRVLVDDSLWALDGRADGFELHRVVLPVR
jgi:hypothetical protein